MLDEALLRPGRLEVQIEIGLPDEPGRLQILKIHTSRMSENSFISRDVDLVHLSEVRFLAVFWLFFRVVSGGF